MTDMRHQNGAVFNCENAFELLFGATT